MTKRNETGLALTEVLVAFVVLATAAIGLFRIASTATLKNTNAKDQVAATQLAMEKLEELRNTAFASIASGSDSMTIGAGGESGGVYTRSWTASSRTVAGVPAKDITVTVSWAGGGSIALSTNVVDPPKMVSGALDPFPTVFLRSWDQTK